MNPLPTRLGTHDVAEFMGLDHRLTTTSQTRTRWSRHLPSWSSLFFMLAAICIISLSLGARAQAATTLSNGVAVNNINGAQGSKLLFQIAVPAGASNLRFVTSGGSSGGDVDIFAKFNAVPTTSSYDAKSDGPTRDESITIAAPQAGTYYLMLNAWTAYSGLQLVASFTPPVPIATLQNGVPVNNISGVQGSSTRFQINVPAGASNLRFTTSGGSGGDVDIFEKFNALPTVNSYDAKSDGPTRNETITIASPQAGTHQLLMYGDWSNYAGVTLQANYDTTNSCPLASSTVVPAIATKAAWDAKYDPIYGETIPGPLNGGGDFAWHGHYWLRAYVSMAKTYGDTKYLDRAVRMIDYWFAHSDTKQGWSSGKVNDPNEPAYTMLNTGIIAQAVSIFAYEVWSDNRFAAYRGKADSYLAQLEPMLHTYDWQWVDGVTDYGGKLSFWRYATCGGLCGESSFVMYNQGATMAKALLMIDRTYRLKGLTPDPEYLRKANLSAAYFKAFAWQNGNAALWRYAGARTNPPDIEDTNHAHVDLSLVTTARKFGLGGLDDNDMHNLVGTMHVILNGGAGADNVWKNINGTDAATDNWDRVSVGYDWIELADYDATLFDKTVKVYNKYLSNPGGSRFYLGWAEILRKRSCTGL